MFFNYLRTNLADLWVLLFHKGNDIRVSYCCLQHYPSMNQSLTEAGLMEQSCDDVRMRETRLMLSRGKDICVCDNVQLVWYNKDI